MLTSPSFFQALDAHEVLSAGLTLLMTMNILGNTAMINTLQKKAGPIQLPKTLLAVSCIMIGFWYGGTSILQTLGISMNAFTLAGWLIVSFVALELLLDVNIFQTDLSNPSAASIVPLAFPMLAGTGTITTLLSIKPLYHDVNILVAIVLNIAFVGFILHKSHWVYKVLGNTGLTIVNKAMGVILLSFAIQFIKANLLA